MSKLPVQLPSRLRNNPHIISAYNMCLKLEKDIQKKIDAEEEDVGRSMIYCRILGYLIHHAPNDQARKTVFKEIVSCENETRLLSLGKWYYDHFIRAFRSNKGRIPTPSSHPSRHSFDTVSDLIKVMMEEAPQNHASAKKKALVRDRFQCPISGVRDAASVKKTRELLDMFLQKKFQARCTECAHIIPESINSGISKGSNKEQYASTVWTILQRFGYEKLHTELNGSKVHRLENVITMEHTVHEFFDNLDIWLTATNELDKYKVEARDPVSLAACHQYVTFTTPDQESLPVPSPAYLALHASCAKVTHLSGAAEYIDKVFEDMEEIRVLSEDGASAEILEHAILYASPRPIPV